MRWRDLTQPAVALDALAAEDPFTFLGVEPTASDRDVRRAFLAMVRRYHPDRVDQFMKPTAQRMLQLANQSYETIRRMRATAPEG